MIQNGLKRMFFIKEKKMVLKEKYLFNFFMKKVFNGYPCKIVKKYFLQIFPLQNILHIFLFTTPPPPFPGPVRNSKVFICLLF